MPEDLTGSRMRGGYTPKSSVVGFVDIAVPAEEWMELGVCKTTDPDSFYPERPNSNQEAKRICRTCPVQAECLEYALEHRERWGVWGGLSEHERRQILRGVA